MYVARETMFIASVVGSNRIAEAQGSGCQGNVPPGTPHDKAKEVDSVTVQFQQPNLCALHASSLGSARATARHAAELTPRLDESHTPISHLRETRGEKLRFEIKLRVKNGDEQLLAPLP